MVKKKFPDLSGDGKTTFKDVLIGRGVIEKKKGGTLKKKKVAKKKVMKKKVTKKKTKRR
jgi:hypothetical protein|tara:strand:- start:368 stop:544 length:177 start_codon:yes stop_codon:yes gene_type:complete